MARLTSPAKLDVPAEILQKLEQYDFVLQNSEETCGFRLHHGSTDTNPLITTHEVQSPSSSGDLTEGDELYSSRDLQDAYRVVFRDFGGGSGQISRDVHDYASNKYYKSENVDISDPSGIKLQPQLVQKVMAGLRGAVIEHNGKLACTVNKGTGASNHQQVWFYDPSTGTESYAQDITANEEAVCLASDGEYVYVALAGSGGIWRGKDDGNPWAAYAASVYGVSHLCYSGGYLYAVKNNELGRITSVGAWDAFDVAGALVPSRVTFGLCEIGTWVYWGVRAGARSWVYSAIYNPADPQGVAERLEQYVELPTGFVGTCMDGYLSQLFIGGYKLSRYPGVNQGAVYLATEQGIALLCNVGEDPNTSHSQHLPADNKVMGVAGYDHSLWIVTSDSVWYWDLRKGGLVHVGFIGAYATSADITWFELQQWSNRSYDASVDVPLPTNGWVAKPQTGEQSDFRTTEFTCAQAAIKLPEDEPYPTILEAIPQALRMYPTTDKPWREAKSWFYTPTLFNDGYVFSNTVGSTFQVVIARITGRCTEFGIRDGQRELAVRLKGGYTEADQTWVMQVGNWVESSQEYEWWESAPIQGRKDLQKIRLSMKGELGQVFINDILFHNAYMLGHLVASDGTLLYGAESLQNGVYFTGGWPWNPVSTAATNYDKNWVVDYWSARYSSADWKPGAVIPRSVTSSPSFTVINSTPYIPTTSDQGDDGLLFLDWDKYMVDESDDRRSGTLTTSWSTARMPGVMKHFSYCDVSFEKLALGDHMDVIIETDTDTHMTAIAYLAAQGTLAKLPLTLNGTKVRVTISMRSEWGTTTPKVSCISLRYGVEPIDRIQALVDLRDNVRMLTGEHFNVLAARDFMDSTIADGQPLMLWLRSGGRRVMIEAAQENLAMPSTTSAYEPQGIYIVKFRAVPNE